jgi:hypothetical protein
LPIKLNLKNESRTAAEVRPSLAALPAEDVVQFAGGFVIPNLWRPSNDDIVASPQNDLSGQAGGAARELAAQSAETDGCGTEHVPCE